MIKTSKMYSDLKIKIKIKTKQQLTKLHGKKMIVKLFKK